MRKFLAATVLAGMAAVSNALAGAEEEMMAVDTAFAAMASEEGVAAAFAAYAAEDVRMFPGGLQPYAGRSELMKRYADWPAGATLEWAPVEAVGSAGGDFGFTWGRYVFTRRDESGEANVSHGKYVSIWRKEPDGRWKFVADIGNANPDPEADQAGQ